VGPRGVGAVRRPASAVRLLLFSLSHIWCLCEVGSLSSVIFAFWKSTIEKSLVVEDSSRFTMDSESQSRQIFLLACRYSEANENVDFLSLSSYIISY
jgi:hypothetical protein